MLFNVQYYLRPFAYVVVSAIGLGIPASAVAQHSIVPANGDMTASQSGGAIPATGISLQQQIDATPVSHSRALFSAAYAPVSGSRNGLPAKGTWALTAEAVFANFDDADQLIGSPDAPQAFGSFSAASLGAVNGEQVGATALDPSLIGQSSSDSLAAGWRAALEYRNNDEGGFQLEGMMVRSGDYSWQRGVGGMNAGADLTTVRVGAALPLDVPGGTAYAVPYDQFFKIELDTSVDSISAMFAPMGFYTGSLRFQPTFGFRYLRVEQELNFSGASSGQLWTANADGTRDTGTAATTVTAPYQSVLTSTSETSLYGPVVGVSGTTTGQLVRLNGLLRAGLLFADENLSLGGRGLGNPLDAGFDPLLPFGDARSQTNATFMFESQVGVDVHIFQLINKLRNRKFGSSLVLRLGWSVLYLDQIVQAADAVRWNGSPAEPSLRRRSSEFKMDSFNVGLVLKY